MEIYVRPSVRATATGNFFVTKMKSLKKRHAQTREFDMLLKTELPSLIQVVGMEIKSEKPVDSMCFCLVCLALVFGHVLLPCYGSIMAGCPYSFVVNKCPYALASCSTYVILVDTCILLINLLCMC